MSARRLAPAGGGGARGGLEGPSSPAGPSPISALASSSAPSSRAGSGGSFARACSPDSPLVGADPPWDGAPPVPGGGGLPLVAQSPESRSPRLTGGMVIDAKLYALRRGKTTTAPKGMLSCAPGKSSGASILTPASVRSRSARSTTGHTPSAFAPVLTLGRSSCSRGAQ
eukprot:9485598-Pyramimonas_sp.AAC.1